MHQSRLHWIFWGKFKIIPEGLSPCSELCLGIVSFLLSPSPETTLSFGANVHLCFLRSTALGVEGLYRVSGNKLDVDSLKALMAEGLLVSAETLRSHYPDKHVVAGAIKKVSTGF